MMSKIAYGLGALMIVAFVATSMAQPKPATTSAPAERLARFIGVIQKIDEPAKTIQVKGKKGEPLTFFTDEKTQMTLGGKEASFGDLKNSMYVVVEYRQEGPKLIAAAVTEAVLRPRRR